MDRNSWHDSYYPEGMPHAPSQRQGRPFREPNYQQGYTPRHSEYPRDNSDYQSSVTSSTFYSQPPSQYNYPRQYQPRNESHYPRKHDRDERPQYSRDNSREQDYHGSSPPHHFNEGYRENARQYRDPRYDPNRDTRYDPNRDTRYDPNRDPRYDPNRDPRYDPNRDTRYDPNRDTRYDPNRDTRYDPNRDTRYDPNRDTRYDPNRDNRGSSYTRDSRYHQSANRYPQRHDTRHFDNQNPSSENSYHRPERGFHVAHETGPVDRQQSDSKYRHYPNRSEPRFSNNSDNQNYQKDANSPVSPRGSVDRQTSDPFYIKWRETPKPRSRCSSTTSSKDDAPRSRDECIICYGTIKILALTPCEHLYCHLCCIRLQILCEDQHCPICRTPFEENPVILLQLSTPSPVYRDLIGSCNRDFIENFKISLLRPLDRGLIDQLFNFKCPVQDCPFIPPRNEKRQLERHLKSAHELYYCHVCMQGLKQFIFEMRLYSWEDLNKHKDGKGESKLDPPGHHGHPLCKFCRDRYLDDTTLYEHLHQTHFWCFICERNNTYVYYSSTEELRFHFKQEHFLCERGDCRQEVFTTAFASEMDFKAHVSSVHAGDLRKNEAKNLRRVDIEFNYASAHQTDQGYRNRNQWKDRKNDQNNDRTDQLSDNEETENNNDEPTTETNQSEFNFKNEEHGLNQGTIIEPPQTVDNRDNSTKPNERPSDPVSTQSPADIANNWPQIEADTIKPVPIVNAHTTTSGSELASRQADRNSALSYSQSLGISKQSGRLFSSNPATQSARPPAPSAYSNVVKPESARTQKHQSQSKPKSQPQPHPQPQDPPSEAAKAPLKKKTYEDVFPALCVGSSIAVPLQTEKQQQQQQPTTAASLGKAGKKSNKQRKKENITSQPLVTQPSDSPPINPSPDSSDHISYPAREKKKEMERSSRTPRVAPPQPLITHSNDSPPMNSNDHKSSPRREKPQPAACPALLPETQSKKKEMSSSRNPRVAPPHNNDSPPMDPTLDSNDHKSSPATVREKPQPAAWPALLPETQSKKKEISSSRNPRVAPPQNNDSPPMNPTLDSNDHKSSPATAREKPQPTAWPALLPETQPKKKEISSSRNPRVAPPQNNDSPPMDPTLDSNDHKPSPATAREKPQPTAWPALLPETQSKKKEISSSRTSAILEPYAQWQPPNKHQLRKSALETHIASSFDVNNELKQYYKNYQNLINRTLPVYEFLQYFKTTFADKFSTIFPEMLVLLPDIGLQQELLEAKHHLYPTVAFLLLPSATSSWSKPTRIQLDTCSTCAQVLLPSDSIDHKGTHSAEDEFPALC